VIKRDAGARGFHHIKQKLWQQTQDSMSTEALVNQYAKKPGLDYLFSTKPIRETVESLVTDHGYAYWDGESERSTGQGLRTLTRGPTRSRWQTPPDVETSIRDSDVQIGGAFHVYLDIDALVEDHLDEIERPERTIFPRRESRRLRRSESDNPKRFANDAMDGYSTLFRTIKSICLHRLYMAIQVTRTYIGSIQNQRQVQSGLDSLGDSASKIWNVARWTADRIWDETGKIPDVSVLKAYMKNQACWKDLNAQSSQKVIEELSDAFQSWFDLRQKDDTANPPGYRKHGDERPRSTVTFKDGFKHDPDNNRVRLSKGSNLKGYWSFPAVRIPDPP